MSARGRFVSCLATAVVALAGFVTLGALPAAGAASVVEYVALGDSYAAGWGAPELTPKIPASEVLRAIQRCLMMLKSASNWRSMPHARARRPPT